MKTIFSFLAVCMAAAVIGCQSTNPTVAPGAVSECGAKCGEACTKDKSECCGAAKCDGTSMGAVSEKCASECSKKSECTKAADEAAMGAVGEKSGCQKRCPAAAAAEADASLGAVSEKSECQKPCGAAKTGCSK